MLSSHTALLKGFQYEWKARLELVIKAKQLKINVSDLSRA